MYVCQLYVLTVLETQSGYKYIKISVGENINVLRLPRMQFFELLLTLNQITIIVSQQKHCIYI